MVKDLRDLEVESRLGDERWKMEDGKEVCLGFIGANRRLE